jgi:putative ABC transport system permease protein
MSGLWLLARRAILARPLRSSLTAVAVALGIAVVLAAQIVMEGLGAQAAAAQQARAGRSALDVRVEAGSGLQSDQVDKLARLAGVAQAVPLYEKRVAAGAAGAGIEGLAVTLVGLNDGSAALRPVTVVAGRLPHRGSTSEVAIDQGLATALVPTPSKAIRLGQRIQMITNTGPDVFTVVGFTSGTSGGPAFTRSAVFIDDAAMLSVFRLGLQTPLVALRLALGATTAGVAAEVHSLLGQAVTTFDPRGGGAEPLSDVRPLLVLMTVLAVIVGAGVTANSAALAVSERRREIGLLRAAGASARQVFRLFAAEVVAVAAAAVPVGIGAGIGLAALLEAGFTPIDLPVPGLTVSPAEVLSAVGAGLGAALMGGMLPAIAAARMPILGALRAHPGAERQAANLPVVSASPLLLVAAALCFLAGGEGVVALGVALLLAGVLAALPVAAPAIARILALAVSPVAPGARSAAAELRRTRNRTALTVAGVSVGVAAAVAVSSLTAGALTASDEWVSHLFVGDMVIHGPVTERDEIIASIQRSPGVRYVTPLRFFSEPVAGAVQGITSFDPAAYQARGGLDVVTPARSDALRMLEDGPSFLVPQELASSAGWSVGDQLPVDTPSGVVYFTVAGVVTHSFPAGDGGESLLVANDVARSYFGNQAAGFDDLVVSTNGNAADVHATANTYGLQAVLVSDIATAARRSLEHAIGLLLALAIVTVVIAMLAVVNTLIVNVRQGTRELAILRAVGMSRRQALRMVLSEAALLAATAMVVGVAAGCLIALPMLHASETPAFAPGFAFPAEIAIALGAVIIATAVVAVFGPARRAVRASVLSALHHE